MLSILISVFSVASIAVAQSTGFSNTNDDYPFTVQPGSVPMNETIGWCRGQYDACNLICGGASPNQCDPVQLTYSCTCVNGPTPNITEYMGTLPFFECQAYKGQCVVTPAALASQEVTDACQMIQCGSKMVPNATVGSSSMSMSMSATASMSTGAPAMTSAASGSNSGASSPQHASYGTGALVAGVVAMFGFAM